MNHARIPAVWLLSLILVLAALAQQHASAVIGWYNGEWQSGIPGMLNWYQSPDNFSCVYDAFDVPEGGWLVVGVFSDNGLYGSRRVSRASWEIRRDMAASEGGAAVASGVSRVKLMPDPSVTHPPYPASEVKKHYRIEVDGLHVQLPPGRYWLSVTPVGSGYLSATRGTNAIGSPAATPSGGPPALYFRTGGDGAIPSRTFVPGGLFGIARHFAQGVLIAAN